MNVKITSDSTCDLSADIIQRYDIGITPLSVLLGDKSYKDGVEMNTDDIYTYVDRTGSLPKTSAVNVEDYLRVFGALRRECDAIVHFTISSDMSSCYLNACTAAKEIGNVYVIDSRSLSTGIGHLVLDACEMAREGMTAEEIFNTLEERKKLLDVSFVIDTLEYLRYGGRCSSLAAFGANLLHLKPSIQVTDGVMGVSRKYRGQLKKCLLDYVDDKLADPDTVDPRRVFITDSGVDDEIWQAVEADIRSRVPFEKVYHTHAGCTVCGHCGPGTLGILFYRKEK